MWLPSAELQAYDHALSLMVKWRSIDLGTSQRSVLRSYDKLSRWHQKNNTVDPKSWLDRAIPDDKGGRNTAEGEEQVKQVLGSLEMMWLVYTEGTIV